MMENKKKMKKAVKIGLIVIGAVLLLAIGLGVYNALMGGNAVFGWNDYRYQETGYTVGDGTVADSSITALEIDWIDGEIEIIACQDAYVSLTESAPEELPDSSRLRWKVENGTLKVKYRKSSWFLGFGSENRDKKLTLRIPERLFDRLVKVEVNAVSTDVSVLDIQAKAFSLESASGDLTLQNCAFSEVDIETVSGKIDLREMTCDHFSLESTSGNAEIRFSSCPTAIEIESVSGDIEFYLPQTVGFTLDWESASGRLLSDFSLDKTRQPYVYGSGALTIEIETVSGNLTIGKAN